MAEGTEAAVVSGVGATGALGIGMTAVALILAQPVARRTVLLQIAARVQVLVQGSARQRFELFVAVDDVRVLLLRFRRHIEQLFNVTVTDPKCEHL